MINNMSIQQIGPGDVAGDVADACRAMRLDPGETASVLAMYQRCPFLLDLVLEQGGSIAHFVRQRLEVRQALILGPTRGLC